MSKYRTVNKMILVGFAGRDPEIREAPEAGRVAYLSLFTDDKGPDGPVRSWHRIVARDPLLVAFLEKHIRKGDRLYTEGRIAYGIYERDGVTIPTAEIEIREVVVLSNPRQRAIATEAA